MTPIDSKKSNKKHASISSQKYVFLIVLLLLLSSIYLKINIGFYNNEIALASKNIDNLTSEISSTEQSLNNAVEKINAIKNNSYFLSNPAYDEAYNFILNDLTDENKYNDSNYNCAHYSRDVNNNAEKNGLRCGYVELNFNSGVPHALIAFNTTDKGIVFFEPQTDSEVDLEIGKEYWSECVLSGEYQRIGYIVSDFNIYW